MGKEFDYEWLPEKFEIITNIIYFDANY